MVRLSTLSLNPTSHKLPNNSQSPLRPYLRILSLPLAPQVRLTRVTKDVTKCSDKTQFWLASLPYRCLEYLNTKLSSEGLYRIPGSLMAVRRWQLRFDHEIDIDLFGETALYDPNEIASLLKKWLSALPGDLVPKGLQAEVCAEVLGHREVPVQGTGHLGAYVPLAVKNMLSRLPPYNYYLLFAITNHLHCVLLHQKENKMTLENLRICVGPCLRLEKWLFDCLVGGGPQCWQGCGTEGEYLR
ncbi:Rho GTPase activation protein [Piedraia hortae CBS 480.64]|uniref:Rho GTPase activation protein n=1 Tax=Piedraia hortae CBS 480.64 TaxID=1314780 RepID=A0A6A7C6B7_9PEZI|nr:Rho GTPase activation protein [Piedraia hortae CBS 480.64]